MSFQADDLVQLLHLQFFGLRKIVGELVVRRPVVINPYGIAQKPFTEFRSVPRGRTR